MMTDRDKTHEKASFKSRRSLLFFVMLFFLTLLLVFGPQIRAVLLMTWWNQVQKKDSLLADCGLSIEIPGGLSTPEPDWFPLVMNYNADRDFSAYKGKPGLRLTILYNFPAYSIKDRCSRLYDPESPYYNSFYGAYIVRNSGGKTPYGFKSDREGRLFVDPISLSEIPSFDYQKLVLRDFGLRSSDFIFKWSVDQEKSAVACAGYEDWFCIDADLCVSGAFHHARKGVFSYMQYGKPKGKQKAEFTPADMRGRIYARYFPKEDVSVFLYIVASDQAVLENCDRMILKKSRITGTMPVD